MSCKYFFTVVGKRITGIRKALTVGSTRGLRQMGKP